MDSKSKLGPGWTQQPEETRAKFAEVGRSLGIAVQPRIKNLCDPSRVSYISEPVFEFLKMPPGGRVNRRSDYDRALN